MGRRFFVTGAGCLACAAAAALLQGCLIHSNSRTEYSGRYISGDAMEKIQTGSTKPDFVLATLGEPSTRSTLDDGTELWKWEYRKVQSGSGTVFLLFNGSNHTERSGAAYVMFKDGVVTKKWRD